MRPLRIMHVLIVWMSGRHGKSGDEAGQGFGARIVRALHLHSARGLGRGWTNGHRELPFCMPDERERRFSLMFPAWCGS